MFLIIIDIAMCFTVSQTWKKKIIYIKKQRKEKDKEIFTWILELLTIQINYMG